ncbi:molybdopterin-dependent oxidoreductase [Streptomyces somaliensis DSM 40738]|uniref:Molybdopterin-dependent oxidoreductase n=1 Tax=Streptomyces somaliensis (strain ATCC 33201 / DSM 40738 / JCM 12659 / KCTC 9044 / NCTC 11332 / NRRL B-12077 / IP 733) TaxID=1134445 RepID=A0AA44DE01_STRE0|nr:molybdopterin-dependent oxidoreductase [Streptomyces somaliensis DSM 40738]
MQIHACLLALRTGRPVKIVYNRFESFFGHVHRHPAKLSYEHGATRDGRLTHVRCRIVLDGGAYASTSPVVVGNAASLSVGPYAVDAVDVEALALYTKPRSTTTGRPPPPEGPARAPDAARPGARAAGARGRAPGGGRAARTGATPFRPDATGTRQIPRDRPPERCARPPHRG